MTSLSVITAGPDHRERALATLTLGFSADPMMRWAFPDPAVYLAVAKRFFTAFGGRAFDAGTAFVVNDARAVALWLPPGVSSDDAALDAVFGEFSRPENAEAGAAIGEDMERFHPKEPHWYLPLIAADPACVGRGLGAALMQHALARCDAAHMPAYLESSNPRNISLYQRHGFEIVGEIQHGASPVLTPMYRAAR